MTCFICSCNLSDRDISFNDEDFSKEEIKLRVNDNDNATVGKRRSNRIHNLERNSVTSVCSSCRELLSSAVTSKGEVEKKEKIVRDHQIELLKKLRELEAEVENFKGFIITLKQGSNNVFKMKQGLQSRDSKRGSFMDGTGVLKYQKHVFDVIQDLDHYYQLVSSSARPILQITQKNNTSKKKVKLSTSVSNRKSSEHEDGMNEKEIKVEIESDEENNSSTIRNQDSSPAPPIIKKEAVDTEKESNNDASDDDRNDIDFCPSPTEEELDDSGDDNEEKKTETCNVLNNKNNDSNGNKTSIRKKYEHRSREVLDFEKKWKQRSARIKRMTMSSFKKSVITTIYLKNKKKEAKSKGYFTPKRNPARIPWTDELLNDIYHRYSFDYDVKQDSLTFGDTKVIINEAKNILQCSLCSFTSETKRKASPDTLMAEHILTVHLTAYKCGKCSKVMTGRGRESYERHIKLTHQGKYQFHCDICGRPFKESPLSLAMHKWSHLSEEEKKEFKNGTKQFFGVKEPYACLKCEKFFLTRTQLRGHQQVHEVVRKAIVCHGCGKQLIHTNSMTIHQKLCPGLVSTEDKLKRRKYYSCHLCERTFVIPQNLKSHLNTVHYNIPLVHKYQCPQCPKKLPTPGELERHVLSHSVEKPYECSKGCGTKFKNKRCKDRHETSRCTGVGWKPFRVNRKVKTSQVESYLCSSCPKILKSRSGMKSHLRICEGRRKVVTTCRRGCGAQYNSYSGRDTHERICDGKLPARGTFECSKGCGNKFKSSKGWKAHETICTGIGWKRVPTKPSIKREPLLCSHCPKSFTTSFSLKEHLIRVAGHSFKPVLCHKGCGAQFSFKSAMYRHKKSCKGKKNSNASRSNESSATITMYEGTSATTDEDTSTMTHEGTSATHAVPTAITSTTGNKIPDELQT